MRSHDIIINGTGPGGGTQLHKLKDKADFSFRKRWVLAKVKKYPNSFAITLLITFEAPFSGMSTNPARVFASTIVANEWKDFWQYCTTPLGMIAGEYVYRRTKKYFSGIAQQKKI